MFYQPTDTEVILSSLYVIVFAISFSIYYMGIYFHIAYFFNVLAFEENRVVNFIPQQQILVTDSNPFFAALFHFSFPPFSFFLLYTLI